MARAGVLKGEWGETGTHSILGVARFVVAVGHPAGTSDFRLAIFERRDLEALKFSDLTDSAVGSSWKPMIRVRSAKGDSTNIYVRPEGKHLKILITSLDGGEASFIQVELKPQALIKFVDEHRTSHGRNFASQTIDSDK